LVMLLSGLLLCINNYLSLFCDTFYALFFKSLCKAYKSIFLELDIKLNKLKDGEKSAKLAGTKLSIYHYWFI
jgi:hypothetical protein